MLIIPNYMINVIGVGVAALIFGRQLLQKRRILVKRKAI